MNPLVERLRQEMRMQYARQGVEDSNDRYQLASDAVKAIERLQGELAEARAALVGEKAVNAMYHHFRNGVEACPQCRTCRQAAAESRAAEHRHRAALSDTKGRAG